MSILIGCPSAAGGTACSKCDTWMSQPHLNISSHSEASLVSEGRWDNGSQTELFDFVLFWSIILLSTLAYAVALQILVSALFSRHSRSDRHFPSDSSITSITG